MPMFKKQKKEETPLYKEHMKEASKEAPEIDEVEIKTNSKQKEQDKEEAQPTLMDIVINMPEVEYKAQVLALLSEILKKMGGEDENAK